jgi:PAS domain S-box-containing protein
MKNTIPSDEEVMYDGGAMITETDAKGTITYVNQKFVDMSCCSKEELIGRPHNIVRHPDMPKCLFKEMWGALLQGKPWEGYLKNLRKDGKYYWVDVYISPRYDPGGNLIGYIARRSIPAPDVLRVVKEKYRKLLALEQETANNEKSSQNVFMECDSNELFEAIRC